MEKESLNYVRNIFLLSLGVLGLSMLVWHWQQLVIGVFIITAIAVIFLTSKSPKTVLLIMTFEICLGSLGKLFTFSLAPNINLSIRLVIFFSLILGSIIHLILNKSAQQQLLINFAKYKTWLIILPLILWPIIIGLLNNKTALVYSDANGWLFYGLLFPILLVNWDKKTLVNILKIFIGTALATILLTLVIYVLYGWGLINYPWFNWLYHWLRQVGWGEVTHVSGNLYRIFSQAHIFILGLWSMALANLIYKSDNFLTNKQTSIILYLTSVVLLINLSRSMWVGGLFIILLLLATQFKKFVANWKKLIIIALLAIITSGLLIGRLGFINFSNRISQQPSEPAIASRIVQLQPLLNGIKAHWLTGTGFGGEIGYPSQDPRAKQHLDANGLFWTTAFEWGYLDQLLKFGVLFFVVFIYFLFQIIKKLYLINNPITNLLLLALLAIYATHMFSPYLNHPLGIGWIIAGITAININKDTL
jgi:hypothetical protein